MCATRCVVSGGGSWPGITTGYWELLLQQKCVNSELHFEIIMKLGWEKCEMSGLCIPGF